MASGTTKPRVEYMAQLDGIRAFAVAGVIIEHWASGLPGMIKRVVGSLNLGGWGVECFFVLSGFLITLILLDLKEQQLSFRSALGHFYMRRVLRIFPAYYAALIGTWLIFPQMQSVLGWHALYLSDIYPAWHGSWPPIGGHFWSLSVEEHFYLFWPLVVLAFPIGTVKRLAIGFGLLGPLSRLAIWYIAGGPHVAIWTVATSAFDLLCFGALLACIKRQFGLAAGSRSMRRLATTGLIALCFYLVVFFFLRTTLLYVVLGRTMIALIFGALVAAAANGFKGPVGSILGNKLVVWLGTISYGLYIFHPFVSEGYGPLVDLIGAKRALFGVYYLRYPLLTALLLLVTSSSYYLLERPVRSLRRHFA